MKKVIMALGLSMLSTLFVFGQSGDTKKGEFYVGYSNGQIDTGVDSGSSINAFFRDRANFNGFEVSGVYNLGRYFRYQGRFLRTLSKPAFKRGISGSHRSGYRKYAEHQFLV